LLQQAVAHRSLQGKQHIGVHRKKQHALQHIMLVSCSSCASWLPTAVACRSEVQAYLAPEV
jgi:hypothetical protein